MASMKSWLGTGTLFIAGVVRRFYYWLPSFLLDPFDFYDKYLKPHTHQPFDLPAIWFFTAFGIGLVIAAIHTAHELRMRGLPTYVTFDHRELVASIRVFNGDREDTPCERAEVVFSGGALFNQRDERVPIDGIAARVAQWRGRLRRWSDLPESSVRVTLRNSMGVVDPYHHEVHVDGHTRSLRITSASVWITLPDRVKDSPRFRITLRVETASRKNLASTIGYVDLSEVIAAGEAEHKRMAPSRNSVRS